MEKLTGLKKSQENQKQKLWTTPDHVPDHVHNHPKDEEIVLKDGEEICDRCDGSGYEPKVDPNQFFRMPCSKCQGDKKVDWISNVTGVAPKEPSYGCSSSGYSTGFGVGAHTHNIAGDVYSYSFDSCISYSGVMNITEDQLEIKSKPIKEYINAIVSKKIDEKMMESCIEQKEQTLNKKGWRKIFDNRIFSKLLFFNNFKQKNKSKKNASTI